MKLVLIRRLVAALGYGVVSGVGVIDLSARFGQRWPTLRDMLAAADWAKPRARQRDRRTWRSTPPVRARDPDPARSSASASTTATMCRDRPDRHDEAGAVHPLRRQPGRPWTAVGQPRVSDDFDYEGEFAVVIGKPAVTSRRRCALDHVAGYACYNEGSVRDWQRHTGQVLSGKTFAGTRRVRPLAGHHGRDPRSGQPHARDAAERHGPQHSTTDLMITPVREQIAYISAVLPADAGRRDRLRHTRRRRRQRKPPLWMKAGDVVEVEISGIGVLRNPVIAKSGLTIRGIRRKQSS